MKIKKDVQAVIFDHMDNKTLILIVKKVDFANGKPRWRLLKGGVEENEDEEQALKREIHEEIGIKKVRVLEKIYEYEFVFDNIKHEVSSFLVWASIYQPIKLENFEILGCAWVKLNNALQLLHWENEKEAVIKAREWLDKHFKF